MNQGLVFTEFSIAPADRARFAGWHTNEHARERLDIAGVVAVQRYVDIADPLHFCCLYRSTGLDVFESPAYASLPDRASQETREIAAGVTGTRFLGEAFGSIGHGQGGLMMRFRHASWTPEEAADCLRLGAEELKPGTISRLEIGRPGPGGPRVDDLSWIVILEGSTLEGLGDAAARIKGQGTGSEVFRLEHAMTSAAKDHQ